MEARGAGADWWDTERSGGLVRVLRILPEGEGQCREEKDDNKQARTQPPDHSSRPQEEDISSGGQIRGRKTAPPPLPDTATNMAKVPAQCSLLC